MYSIPMDLIGSKDPEEHLKRMKKLFLKTRDEILRGHICRLSKAWGIKVRLPRQAA